jgi:hypothetical protein
MAENRLELDARDECAHAEVLADAECGQGTIVTGAAREGDKGRSESGQDPASERACLSLIFLPASELEN